MKIIAITVTSLDGRFTKGSEKNIYQWSSKEDFEHFKEVVNKHNLLVMGSGTFEPVKDIKEVGLKPEKERLRIIMTRNPERYKEFVVPGQMEFTNESPRELVTRLEKQGYQQMLLVGGSRLSGSFLQEGLINELLITIEPKLFGNGDFLHSDSLLDTNLQLLDVKKLNQKGTMVLHYKILT